MFLEDYCQAYPEKGLEHEPFIVTEKVDTKDQQDQGKAS